MNLQTAPDFRHIRSQVPVSFWMPRDAWEKLPIFEDVRPSDEHILFRDRSAEGVVYRWMGAQWWQARLSFEPRPPAQYPWVSPPRSKVARICRKLAEMLR